jgi:type IV secretory pathway TrbD component
MTTVGSLPGAITGHQRGERDGERFGSDAIHPSLVRPVLYLGVERPVIALEATFCAALLFGVGPNALTFLCVAVVVTVTHPVAVWLTARDPQAVELYLRSRAYADFHTPLAPSYAPTPRPRASVPTAS